MSKITAAYKNAYVENYDVFFFLANLTRKNAAFKELSTFKVEEEKKNFVQELMM
jgi:hypothetical protein